MVIDGEKDSYFPLEVFGLFTVRECCWGLDLPVSKRDLVVPWVRRVRKLRAVPWRCSRHPLIASVGPLLESWW